MPSIAVQLHRMAQKDGVLEKARGARGARGINRRAEWGSLQPGSAGAVLLILGRRKALVQFWVGGAFVVVGCWLLIPAIKKTAVFWSLVWSSKIGHLTGLFGRGFDHFVFFGCGAARFGGRLPRQKWSVLLKRAAKTARAVQFLIG